MRAFVLVAIAAAVVAWVLTRPLGPAPADAQTTGHALDDAVALVPADAMAFVALDLSETQPAAFPFSLLAGSGSLLQTALDETLSRRLGVRLTSLGSVVGYLAHDADSWGIAVLGTVSGTPTAAGEPYRAQTIHQLEGGGFDGEDLFVAVTPAGVAMGTLVGVTGLLDVAFGGVPSVTASPSSAVLLAARDPQAVVLAWSGPEALFDLGQLTGPLGSTPMGMSLTIGAERIRWSVDAGSAADASALDAFAALMLQQARAEMETMFAALEGEESLLTEVMARLARASSSQVLAEGIRHEVAGTLFHAELLDDEGLAWVSIAAAVAIPAFLKYIGRSRTTEATMNIRRLYDSSVSYFDMDHVTPTGEILPPQFPASVPLTPAEIPCGAEAAPNAAQWNHPTWQALNFAVSDPHYYSYQYDSSGVGVGATFTATAFGDLDCDGVYSTFVRVGQVNEGMEVQGGAGLYMTNELE